MYDFQVETLFLGSADTMSRQALPFISRWMEGRDASDTKVLDVASGTGRFLTFVRDNWPELDCTAVELSPHYLDAVRKSNERFDYRTLYPKSGPLKLVEANCETMPFEVSFFLSYFRICNLTDVIVLCNSYRMVPSTRLPTCTSSTRCPRRRGGTRRSRWRAC